MLRQTITICLLSVMYSCSSGTQKSGEVLSIKYKTNMVFNTKSYLNIDGVIIHHTTSNRKIKYANYLPAQYIKMFGSKENPIVHKTTPKMVINKLFKILNSSNKYFLDSLNVLHTKNELIIRRKDLKKIKISFPENYPIKIKEIKRGT